MSMRKHIVRTIVLGLVGTTLAFAHPTDPGVGSPSNLSEMRQEKLAFVRYRIARAAAELDSVQARTLTGEEEMRQEKMSAKAFMIFDQRGVLTDADLADADLSDADLAD